MLPWIFSYGLIQIIIHTNLYAVQAIVEGCNIKLYLDYFYGWTTVQIKHHSDLQIQS